MPSKPGFLVSCPGAAGSGWSAGWPYFRQLSDFQLADEGSPARLEFLDKLISTASAAWRPQEAFQPHVIDQSIRQVNRFARRGPHTYRGKRAALILTSSIAYAVREVRPGSRERTLRRRFRAERRIRSGRSRVVRHARQAGSDRDEGAPQPRARGRAGDFQRTSASTSRSRS